MALERALPLTAVVGGTLLGLLSMFWLGKSLELVLDNASCCLLVADGDGRRGIFYATVAGCFQVATLALAIGVVLQRGLRAALAVVVALVAATAILLSTGGVGEVQLWLSLITLVVAGLAITAVLVGVRHVPSTNTTGD